MTNGQWEIHPIGLNGHKQALPSPRKWRYTVKDVAVIWVAALAMSWLMGLGAVKLIEIVDTWLRRS